MLPRIVPRLPRVRAGAAVLRPCATLLLIAAACDGSDARSNDRTVAGPPVPAATPLTFDFGTIQHGKKAQHDFEVIPAEPTEGIVPVAFRSGCSCAVPTFWIRSDDGSMRAVDALPRPMKTLQRNDILVLRLTVDTGKKEPVDQPSEILHGAVILQRADNSRLEVPIVFSYAIDAPIELQPVAHFDFGALPQSRSYESSITLHPDQDHADVTFGAVSSSDPRVVANLQPDGDAMHLSVVFRPHADDPLGPVLAVIRIPTSLEGYALEVPVSGQLVSDIQVTPFAHISFGRIELSEPAEQFVNVADHDLSRPAGFEVASITDTNGLSLDEHFAVRLVPIEGDPRATRMYLRYLGTISGEGFRGTVTLAKPGGLAPFTKVSFVGFQITR